MDKLTDDIEAELYNLGKAEISGAIIGDMVMARLKELDHVAYIRFASVYRDFTDITMLKQAVDSLVSGAAEHAAGQLPLLPDEPLAGLARGKRRSRR